jgi:hypothetical protein
MGPQALVGVCNVEGSAVATVVLAVLAFWSYRYYRKAEARRCAGAGTADTSRAVPGEAPA